jgi:hypothetical protein
MSDIDVDFIGGPEEDYMITDWRGPEPQTTIFLSLEEVEDMIKQFKKLLKPEQWNRIIYPPAHDVEKYYKEESK